MIGTIKTYYVFVHFFVKFKPQNFYHLHNFNKTIIAILFNIM